jgi:phosphoribosylamine-glycine ligase
MNILFSGLAVIRHGSRGHTMCHHLKRQERVVYAYYGVKWRSTAVDRIKCLVYSLRHSCSGLIAELQYQ